MSSTLVSRPGGSQRCATPFSCVRGTQETCRGAPPQTRSSREGRLRRAQETGAPRPYRPVPSPYVPSADYLIRWVCAHLAGLPRYGQSCAGTAECTHPSDISWHFEGNRSVKESLMQSARARSVMLSAYHARRRGSGSPKRIRSWAVVQIDPVWRSPCWAKRLFVFADNRTRCQTSSARLL